MTDDNDWCSVEEAARRLGVSGATVRRRVRDGTLEGYREQRPQGEVYRVLSSALPPDSQAPRKTEEMAEENRENVSVSPDRQPLSGDMADLLDALLQTNAAMLERQGDRIALLERENGRLQANVTNLAERLAEEVVRREEAEAKLGRPWWRVWAR